MDKRRAARRIQNGNFLVVTRRRSIDPHHSRIDRGPRWRQQASGTASATCEEQHHEPAPGQPAIRDRAMMIGKKVRSLSINAEFCTASCNPPRLYSRFWSRFHKPRLPEPRTIFHFVGIRPQDERAARHEAKAVRLGAVQTITRPPAPGKASSGPSHLRWRAFLRQAKDSIPKQVAIVAAESQAFQRGVHVMMCWLREISRGLRAGSNIPSVRRSLR
jgi:hypothetical protein